MRTRKIAIITARYHTEITSALEEGARQTLLEGGIDDESIQLISAPGAFELPVLAANCVKTGQYAAVICLGCVIQGETAHNHYINQSVAMSLGELAVRTCIPVIFGLLTTDTREQAEARCGIQPPNFSVGKKPVENKGVECAAAALAVLSSLSEIAASAVENEFSREFQGKQQSPRDGGEVPLSM